MGTIRSILAAAFVVGTCLIPIVALPERHHFYDVTPKVCILYVSAALAVLWFALGYCRGITVVRLECAGKVGFALCLYLGALTVSTVLSDAVELSIGGAVWRRVGYITIIASIVLGYCVGLWLREDTGNGLVFLRLTIAVGCVVATVGLFQVVARGNAVSVAIPDVVFRPPATVGHAGYYSTFLIGPLCLSIAMLSEVRLMKVKCVLLAVIVLLSVSLAVSGSRSALVGAVVALIMLAILRRGARSAPEVWRFYKGAGLVLIAVVVTLVSPGGLLVDRVAEWMEDGVGGPRLLLWRDIVAQFGAISLFGSGVETFSRKFPLWQSVELFKAYPDHFHESPHNIVLEILVEQGVVSLAAVIWILALVAKRVLKRRSLVGDSCGVAVLGMLVSLQFTPLTVTNVVYLAVFIGAVVWVGDEGESPMKADRWNRTMIGVVAVGFGFILFMIAAQLDNVDRNHREIDRCFRVRDVDGLRKALAELKNSRAIGESAEYIVYKRLSGALGGASVPFMLNINITEMVATAERSISVSSEPFNVALFAGCLAYVSRDLASAERLLRKAAELSPTWHKPHVALMLVYEKSGRKDAASKELVHATRRAGVRALEDYQVMRRFMEEGW